MFGVVDSDTVTYLNWFTFVVQVEMFGVVDSDTDTYLNCFNICPAGGNVWCG